MNRISTTLSSILAVGMIASAPAQAAGISTVSISGNEQGFVQTVVENGPAQIGGPPGGPLQVLDGESHYGVASSSTQTLRAYADGYGPVDAGNQVKTTSTFSLTVPVLAGSSGLAIGIPITIFLDLALDGRIVAGPDVGANSAEYSLDTRAFGTLRYRVVDLDEPEGGAPLTFDYTGFVQVLAGAGPTFDTYARTSYEGRASATRQDGSTWNWAGNSSGGRTGLQLEQLTVDTGIQRFAFNTFVGHQLQLNGELQVGAFGLLPGLPWQATADFSRTFDAELLSSVPGVEFGDLVPGVYVPAPPTSALLATGLAMLGGRLRRRRG